MLAANATRDTSNHFLRLILFWTLPLYAIDQVSKWMVRRYLDDAAWGGMTMIPNFFTLVSVTNTGAAFGMFHNNNRFFIILSLGAFALLCVLGSLRVFSESAWSRAGFVLLVAGILGNLTDRLLFGHVIDFLQFDLHVPGANPWPAFNVADSCICVAAGCFVLGSLFEAKPRPR